MSTETMDGHPCACCLRWPECNGVEWPRCQNLRLEKVLADINAGMITINEARERLGLPKKEENICPLITTP